MTDQSPTLRFEARTPPSRMPGPRGMALLRLIKLIRGDRIAVLETVRRNHGDLAELRIGPTRIVLVSEPDRAQAILRDSDNFAEKGLGLTEARYFLGRGLLTSSGADWSSSRAALTGLFRSDRIDPMLAVTEAAVTTTLQGLQDEAGSARQIDIQPVATRIAFATIATEVLGSRYGDHAEAILTDLQTLARWTERRLAMPFDAVTRLAWFGSPNTINAYRRLVATLARTDAATGSLGTALARNGLADPDLLRDQILTLLLAGHETTSAAISWTLELLSRHPAIADRIADEARAALATGSGTFESDRHPLLRAAVKETLRLFPPVWVLPRRAVRDTRIGDYRVRAGTHVLINVYGLHRHPRLWRDPNQFVPDRFGCAELDPPAYMPFGLGARRCLGMHLGLAEAMIVTAGFLAQYRLTPCTPETPAHAGLTLHPRDGVPLRLESRSRATSSSAPVDRRVG
jgi:cytochrome P450